ncbi:hypothetical protein PIB30_082691 [Stylosanthes scabra]|uniref:Uncharacterized protein n=1 Tax=Stylosanthes scabra TaxID=79078 RepID=A0ABU6RSL0_9FABA|nr:hypothetical protein [Stylosanthes scabra]
MEKVMLRKEKRLADRELSTGRVGSFRVRLRCGLVRWNCCREKITMIYPFYVTFALSPRSGTTRRYASRWCDQCGSDLAWEPSKCHGLQALAFNTVLLV